MTESELLEATVTGDERGYAELLEPHRGALHAHCYRMLGSTHDAEDAVQETLLRAWRGLSSFEGRSSLRSWLYTIATNVCLRMIERRPKRVLPIDHGPPGDPRRPLGEPLVESTWIEPDRDVVPRARGGRDLPGSEAAGRQPGMAADPCPRERPARRPGPHPGPRDRPLPSAPPHGAHPARRADRRDRHLPGTVGADVTRSGK
jgi:RNA polymerase sigma factor (sigma-70 family)